MKVQCLINEYKNMPKDLIGNPTGLRESGDKLPLLVGKEYTVYAITVQMDRFWYYICDEHNLSYPIWKPSTIFKVTEAKLSKYWLVGIHEYSGGARGDIIAFKEWVNEARFYENLIDGNEREKIIFSHYKKKIDFEIYVYDLSALFKKAISANENEAKILVKKIQAFIETTNEEFGRNIEFLENLSVDLDFFKTGNELNPNDKYDFGIERLRSLLKDANNKLNAYFEASSGLPGE